MKRSLFLKKMGGPFVQGPLILSLISIASCKKETSITTKKEQTTANDNLHTTSLPIKTVTVIPDNKIANGYPDQQSYLPGQQCTIFLSATEKINDQTVNVYDVNGKVSFIIPFSKIYPQVVNTDAPYQNGFGYLDGVVFNIPAVIKSGVYLVANSIPIIIKSLGDNPDFTVVYPRNTENAYCTSGGRSLYTIPVATSVSFLRPIPYGHFAAGFLKWLDAQGAEYDYNVIADVDMDDINNMKGKILIVIGHNEYWSMAARKNLDRLVNEGRNALILSGNTMWWQARYNDQKDKLICYKSISDDPETDPLLKTATWPDRTLKYPTTLSIGIDFKFGGYGQRGGKGWQGWKISNPDLSIFRGLNLKKGDIIPLPTVEYDGAPVTGYDNDGFPILNAKILNFYKLDLIGYDFGTWDDGRATGPTAIMFKKTKTSGTIINMASTDWCSLNSFYGNNMYIPLITANAINDLLG